MNSINERKMNYTTALQRASALCAGSEHCRQDIREKLTRWEVSTEDADKILEFLVDEKYIDESRFSRAYALDKMRYNHWGRQKIDQGLRLLHIDGEIRSAALAELPDEEYCDILSGLLQSKQRSIKARNSYERNGKLIRFAMGRGFEMEYIRECLPDVEEYPENDESDEDW